MFHQSHFRVKGLDFHVQIFYLNKTIFNHYPPPSPSSHVSKGQVRTVHLLKCGSTFEKDGDDILSQGSAVG